MSIAADKFALHQKHLNDYIDTSDYTLSPESLVTTVTRSVLLETGDPGVWMEFTSVSDPDLYRISGRVVVRAEDGAVDIYDMLPDDTELFFTHFFGAAD